MIKYQNTNCCLSQRFNLCAQVGSRSQHFPLALSFSLCRPLSVRIKRGLPAVWAMPLRLRLRLQLKHLCPQSTVVSSSFIDIHNQINAADRHKLTLPLLSFLSFFCCFRIMLHAGHHRWRCRWRWRWLFEPRFPALSLWLALPRPLLSSLPLSLSLLLLLYIFDIVSFFLALLPWEGAPHTHSHSDTLSYTYTHTDKTTFVDILLDDDVISSYWCVKKRGDWKKGSRQDRP